MSKSSKKEGGQAAAKESPRPPKAGDVVDVFIPVNGQGIARLAGRVESMKDGDSAVIDWRLGSTSPEQRGTFRAAPANGQREAWTWAARAASEED